MKYIRLIGPLIFILLLLRVDFHEVVVSLSHANLLLVVAAIALNGPMVGLKAWRWQFLLGMQDQPYSLWRAVVVYFSSLFVGFLTPGRLGELVKALYLARDTGTSVSQAMSSVITDRLFDLYALLLCGGYGIIIFSALIDVPAIYRWLIAGAMLISLLLVHPSAEKPVVELLRRAPLQEYSARLALHARAFYAGMTKLWRPKLGIAVTLTAAAYLVFFFQCYLLAHALSLPINFAFVVFSISMASLVTLLPISVSGIGTRDAVLIAVLTPVGFGSVTAVAYSTLILLTFYVAAGSIGAVAWFFAPIDSKLIEQVQSGEINQFSS